MIKTRRLKEKEQTIQLEEPGLHGDGDRLENINEHTLNFVINEKKNTCVVI